MSKRKFDFNSEDFKSHCIAKQKYLKSCYGKKVELDDFVKAINAMPKHIHWSRRHSPNAAKHLYVRLTNVYEFFGLDK